LSGVFWFKFAQKLRTKTYPGSFRPKRSFVKSVPVVDDGGEGVFALVADAVHGLEDGQRHFGQQVEALLANSGDKGLCVSRHLVSNRLKSITERHKVVSTKIYHTQTVLMSYRKSKN
jgi:hypothetical protein